MKMFNKYKYLLLRDMHYGIRVRDMDKKEYLLNFWTFVMGFFTKKSIKYSFISTFCIPLRYKGYLLVRDMHYGINSAQI